MKFIRTLFVLFIMITVTGCTTMSIEDHTINQPEFNLEAYFTGNTKAWGFFQDRKGAVIKQFSVDINGRMEGNTLILEEDFIYSDGTTDQRIWRIEKTGPNLYTGAADDVIGSASGVIKGNALNWKYTLALPVKESIINVQMDDWMYLQPDGILINKARMSKFGVRLGDVTLTFLKKE